jgi:hypothetical protein
MGRRRGKGRLLGAILLVAGVFCVTLPAPAGNYYSESKEPVFLEAQPDRAVVYVLREAYALIGPHPDVEVFLDMEPVGYLPQRSYIVERFEPGQRLLWDSKTKSPVGLVLEPGKIYVLRLIEDWGVRGELVSSAWASEDPGSLQSIIRGAKLSYAMQTQEGLTGLMDVAQKQAPAVLKRGAGSQVPVLSAPGETSLPLPHTFEDVVYRPAKLGAQLNLFKVFKSKGSLTVTDQGLDFKGDKESMTIPMKDIREISSGPVGAQKSTQWVIVEFGDPDSPEVAAFTRRRFVLARIVDRELYSTLKTARELPSLRPLEQIERVVSSAESFAAGGALNSPNFQTALGASDEAEKRRNQLIQSDEQLSKYLAEKPADLEALFLRVRLGHVFRMISTTKISGGPEVKVETPPLPGNQDPQQTLDRILELSPGNGRALEYKARFYSLRNPLTGKMEDAEKTLRYARLAVEAEPENVEYRTNLATFLILDSREPEAKAVFDTPELRGHPLGRLLRDWERLPIPEGAVPERESALGLAEMEVAAGRIGDFPLVRVREFAVGHDGAWVESFYRKSWEDFKLYEMEKEEEDPTNGAALKMLAARWDWKGDAMVLSKRNPSKKETGNSLTMVVFEIRNPTPEVREQLGIAEGEVISSIVLYNSHVLE